MGHLAVPSTRSAPRQVDHNAGDALPVQSDAHLTRRRTVAAGPPRRPGCSPLGTASVALLQRDRVSLPRRTQWVSGHLSHSVVGRLGTRARAMPGHLSLRATANSAAVIGQCLGASLIAPQCGSRLGNPHQGSAWESGTPHHWHRVAGARPGSARSEPPLRPPCGLTHSTL